MCMSSILAMPMHAHAEELVVPAYYDPYGSGLAAWSTIASTAHSVPTTVILNPDSGPGKTADANYVAAIARVHAAGGKVIGYVSTVYGKRALSAVVKDINTYLSFYRVDGFFIDEMTSDSVTAHVQYYQSVHNYIKGMSATLSVTCNPGTDIPELYASLPVADRFVVFEDTAKRYAKYAPAAWQANYPRSRFIHIVIAATAAQAPALVQGAAGRGAGGVYVTSGTLPNPYKGLPKYWAQEEAAAR
ncbi:spherulation-specific family 4 protein [Paraburkholderia sp.]|uniref:spherulation-specific family 4 protein n=1 Tax=Paraburkholderia sp. TaxID=1926495 RepID=UPI003D6FA070